MRMKLMRKPSEIIDKASRDPRYKPTKIGTTPYSYQYLCVLLDRMYFDKDINLQEVFAAKEQIMIALKGHATLSNYLGAKAGIFCISRQRYTKFWRKLVEDLQIRDL